ncbi:MAG: hypothetical protein EOM62_17210 [Bacteroidia bacterium]|nr:hypothetical protein [Bacteroidia bacterium]
MSIETALIEIKKECAEIYDGTICPRHCFSSCNVTKKYSPEYFDGTWRTQFKEECYELSEFLDRHEISLFELAIGWYDDSPSNSGCPCFWGDTHVFFVQHTNPEAAWRCRIKFNKIYRSAPMIK